MNEYLKKLNRYLAPLPEAEREETMEYYQEFFLDADLDGEAIEKKFGTPKQLARTITAESLIHEDDELVHSQLPPSESRHKRVRMAWMIILGLFASPILIPLAISVLILGVALLFTILMLILSFFVVLLSLLVGGVVLIVSGFGVIMQSFSTAIFNIGLGVAAIGFTIAVGPFAVKLVSFLWNKLIDLIKYIGRRFLLKNKQEVA
jgi:uncharacterized membrane protein